MRITKRIAILVLAASSCAFAQDGNVVFYQAAGAAVGVGALAKGPGGPVQGAPYSATITNESVQSLADGNRIVQSTSGTIARDSQGRTRQDAPLPAIGNLSAAHAPHLVFIQDPVAQTSYTLNLTDKTAQKMPMPPFGGPGGPMTAGVAGTFFIQSGGGPGGPGPGGPGPVTVGAAPLPPPPAGMPPVMIQRSLVGTDPAQVSTENLGSQSMEGVLVNGTRTTRTIPVGQIGNDGPISIVTEVWMSPDLRTIVYSKRSDPRMGQQTFRLTGIVRSEPDASLFTVPADFTIVDGPQAITLRSSQ